MIGGLGTEAGSQQAGVRIGKRLDCRVRVKLSVSGMEASYFLEGPFISMLLGDFVVSVLWHYTTQAILPGLCTGT